MECPPGNYCPEGTGIDWQMCPPGTYNNNTGLSQKSQCKPCTGGSYCDDHGAINPKGLCAAGYYCEYGSDRIDPTGGNYTVEINGTCRLDGMLFTGYFLYVSDFFTVIILTC